MYLSTLRIRGYRLFRDSFEIGFEKGLTVLVGENGTGKSAIVDALRLLLLEDEYGRGGVSSSDFHRPIDQPAASRGGDRLELHCVLDDLDERAQAAYLPWLDIKNTRRAFLNLAVENREDQRGRFKRRIWGGESATGLFEWELLNAIVCAYLPPLRDANSRLGAYRGSRLARLLRSLGQRGLGEGEQHPLETQVNVFNRELLGDETIQRANKFVRDNMINALGTVLGQDAMIQFSEVKFERIVERLKLLFYPHLPQNGQGTAPALFRELDENSLGYNNVMYLATVLAELEDLDSSEVFVKIVLIEEPEAHLHPQLQVKLLGYLQNKAKLTGIQVIVTTHSPTIAASVALESIKVLTRSIDTDNPVVSSIKDCGLSAGTKFFIARWLDITKSTLLFARGVILVEGITEALLMSEFGRIVIGEGRGVGHNGDRSESLEDYGVSVINMGGGYFKHFMQLFAGHSLSDQSGSTRCDKIPVRCAGIIDCDPRKDSRPTASSPCDCGNPQYSLLARKLENHPNCRLFCNLKTLEYDLAMEGNNLQLMGKVLSRTVSTDGPIKRRALDLACSAWGDASEEAKSEEASWLLDHISRTKGEFAQLLAQELSEDHTVDFSVPGYLRQAILWAAGLS